MSPDTSREIPPLADPHIQAFTILSDRISNIEDDVSLIKSALVHQELRQTGRLNHRLIGFPFEVTCVPSEEIPADGTYVAAVVEIVTSGDGSVLRDYAVTADTCRELDTAAGSKFSLGYELVRVDGDPCVGLIAGVNEAPDLCDFINAALRLGDMGGPVCAARVYPCDMLDLILFFRGILYEKGKAELGQMAVMERLRCTNKIRKNRFFSDMLGAFPKFAAFLSGCEAQAALRVP
jgi:hypothetical protein